ncbi:MAG: hypothetical protein AB7P52_19385 [Alphaproteobacteria bacterium]
MTILSGFMAALLFLVIARLDRAIQESSATAMSPPAWMPRLRGA